MIILYVDFSAIKHFHFEVITIENSNRRKKTVPSTNTVEGNNFSKKIDLRIHKGRNKCVIQLYKSCLHIEVM